jgi:ABC-2 type transport system ATP-binding protein
MSALSAPIRDLARPHGTAPGRAAGPTIEARSIRQAFDARTVLDSVSLEVRPGAIHALLGPNGAGKTTLIRILCGLLIPTDGSVRIAGSRVASSRAFRRLVGLVPSGDRTFYLRISALENLVFFARLHGLSRGAALERARQVLADVGLSSSASTRVGLYSHGMQKRLSVARALLVDPPILLIDEATHDLDPDGALRVRELVTEAASRGAAVVWATQRLDEIRGFADGVTLLSEGRAAFEGTVPELMATAAPRRYVMRLRHTWPRGSSVLAIANSALAALGRLELVTPSASEHYLLTLADEAVLGVAVTALTHARFEVLTCREERSEIEQAFLALAGTHQ